MHTCREGTHALFRAYLALESRVDTRLSYYPVTRYNVLPWSDSDGRALEPLIVNVHDA